jgi:hypothetical protein
VLLLRESLIDADLGRVMLAIAGGILLAVAKGNRAIHRFESKVRFAAIFIGCFVLAGGASEPKQYMTSEYSDDKTCRSFMKNKQKSDDTTYQECRQSLVDFANNPPVGAPTPSNVTIIVNQ